jgi:hypothetical protein
MYFVLYSQLDEYAAGSAGTATRVITIAPQLDLLIGFIYTTCTPTYCLFIHTFHTSNWILHGL